MYCVSTTLIILLICPPSENTKYERNTCERQRAHHWPLFQFYLSISSPCQVGAGDKTISKSRPPPEGVLISDSILYLICIINKQI